MKDKIYGCDISRHNGENAVKNCLGISKSIDFVIAKATEGRTYVDPMFERHLKKAEVRGLLLGAYHYARPDNGNTAQQEAVHFVNTIKPYIGKCLFAIDWEDKALIKSDPSWALEWCRSVEAMTGVKPLVYVQESYVKNMTAFAGQDFGLWVAKWDDESPTVSPNWDFWAIWQTTNVPFDRDIFNGSREQFRKYCKVSTVESDECNCECHYCGCSNKG